MVRPVNPHQTNTTHHEHQKRSNWALLLRGAPLCGPRNVCLVCFLCFFLLNVFIFCQGGQLQLQTHGTKKAKASLLLGAGLFEKVGGQTQPNIKITLALLADTCKLRQSHFVVLFFTSVLLRRLIKFCLATETTLQGAVYLCCSLVAPRER